MARADGGGGVEPGHRNALWHATPHQGVLVECQRRCRPRRQDPSPDYRRGDAPLRSRLGGRLRRFHDPASRGGRYAMGKEARQPAECHTGDSGRSSLDAAHAADYRPDQSPSRSSGDLDHDLLPPKSLRLAKGSTINIWDQNKKQIHYRWATIDETHRTVTAQRSFSQPGVYSIRPYAEWNLGFGPYRITVGSVPSR